MITKWANCTDPIIRVPLVSLGEKDAVLMEDWHIDDVSGFRFTVPAGTRTDGASIPRFLWRICGHPLMAPRVYAALLHDWLYGGGEPTDPSDACAWPCDLSREEADGCYYAISRHFGIPWWKAAIEHRALRWFGKAHYYRKEKTT